MSFSDWDVAEETPTDSPAQSSSAPAKDPWSVMSEEASAPQTVAKPSADPWAVASEAPSTKQQPVPSLPGIGKPALPAGLAGPAPTAVPRERYYHGEPIGDQYTGTPKEFQDAMGSNGAYGATIPKLPQDADARAKIGNAVMRVLANVMSPDSAAQILKWTAAGGALPAVANLPRVAGWLSDLPAVLKGLDVAANTAVPVAGAAVGVGNIVKGGVPHDIEAGTEAAVNALMVGAGVAGAIEAGRNALAAYPPPLVEPPAKTAYEGAPNVPEPEAQAAAPTAAEELRTQGRNLAATAWQNLADWGAKGNKPFTVKAGQADLTVEPLPRVKGQPPGFLVKDSQGKILTSGVAGDVKSWLDQNIASTKANPEGGGAISVGQGAAEISELPTQTATVQPASASSAPSTASTPKISVGSKFELPTGTFEITALSNGKVTGTKDSASGVTPFTLPAKVFEKMVARVAAMASPEQQKPEEPGWKVVSEEPNSEQPPVEQVATESAQAAPAPEPKAVAGAEPLSHPESAPPATVEGAPATPEKEVIQPNTSAEEAGAPEQRTKIAAPPIREGSSYDIPDNDPQSMLDGAREQYEGHAAAIQNISEQLKDPKLKEKKRQELTDALESQKHMAGATLSEIQDAFGPDTAMKVYSAVSSGTVNGRQVVLQEDGQPLMYKEEAPSTSLSSTSTEGEKPEVETLKYRVPKGNDKIDVYVANHPGKGWEVEGDFNLQGQAGGHLGSSGFDQFYPTREEAIREFVKNATRPQNTLTAKLASSFNTPATVARQQKMIDWVKSLSPEKAPDKDEQESEEPKREYSSTQFNLPSSLASSVKAFAAKIPDSDLAEHGRETEPHVTIRWGLHDNESAGVEQAIKGQKPVKVVLGKTSIFKTPDADVLKVDVESPELHALNGKLGALPNTQTHPKYVPHVTIAYLKKGAGEKYAGKTVSLVTGMKPTLDTVTFSPAQGEAKHIKLQQEAVPQTAEEKIAANNQRIAELTKTLKQGEKKPVTPQVPNEPGAKYVLPSFAAGQQTAAKDADRYPQLDRFMEAYVRNLKKTIEQNPKDFAYPVSLADDVAERMKKAIVAGSASFSGKAFAATAKEFGIKPTEKAIKEFLASKATETPLETPVEKPTMEAGNEPAAAQPEQPAGHEPVRSDHPEPLETELPEGSEPTGEGETVAPSSGKGSGTRKPRARTGAREGDELEPGGGTVSGVVGDAAEPERTFPPRAADVVSTRHDRDYRIPDGRVISGSPETRAQNNIEAITTLREIQQENRVATVQEQQLLAGYVGWGAVPQLFAGKPEFLQLQEQLRNLLTPEEYDEAQRSTTNAHYTSDEIVDAMWRAVQTFGGTAGMSWLEPAVGVGNFFGRQPESMLEGARRIGLDKDALSAQIAKLLYPDSGIDHAAFEDAELPNNYFDGSVSNIPFGNFGVHDASFKGKPFLTNPIHNYFFARTLRAVRPGGVVAFVTSRYTMDNVGQAATNFRRYVAEQAHLIGAVRLPTGAFRQSSGTDVITDLIFLRKKLPDEKPLGQSWLLAPRHSVMSKHGYPVQIETNEYFQNNPEMILGKEGTDRGQFTQNDYHVSGTVTGRQISDAIANFPKIGFEEWTPAKRQRTVAIRELNLPAEQSKLGGLFFDDKGNLLRKTSKGAAEPVDVKESGKARIKGQLAIRDALLKLHDAELKDKPEQQLTLLRKILNNTYDNFVRKNGPLSSQANTAVLKGDPDAPLLVSLERRFNKGNKAKGENPSAEKAPIFARRMLRPPQVPTSVGDPKEALYISLNEKGRIDWPRMEELSGRSAEQLQQDLAGLVFHDPETRTWQTAEEYLSGSVRKKLKDAKAVAKIEPQFTQNIAALEAAQPEDVPPGRIKALLGVTWVPLDVYQQFAAEMLGAERPIKIRYVAGNWTIDPGYQVLSNGKRWGTARVPSIDILTDTFNMQRIVVRDRDSDGSTTVNAQESQAAQNKQMEMQDHFDKWLFADPTRGDGLVRLYNDTQNDLRLRTYDGSHLTLPGMSRDAAVIRNGDLDPHQKAAVWRQIVQPNVLLAHAPGAGKTFEMIAAGMELKRLGLIRRPMYLVPNSTLTSWQQQFAALYPQAKVLVFTEQDLEKQKRQQIMAQIATGDWDAVAVPHSSFQKLPTGDEIFEEHYQKMASQLEQSIQEANEAGVDTRQVKRMEKSKERLLKSLKDRRDVESKDQTVTWEQLGIDQLFVDESHYFRKLGFATKQTNIAGIDSGSNQMTFDLLMKVRYTQNRGRGVVFATGTPVVNTMGELFNIMKYLIEPELEARGIGRFDEWAAEFGRTVPVFEPKVEGGGYRMKARFSKFVNLPRLATLFRSFADVMTSDQLKLPIPELVGGARQGIETPLSDAQSAYMADLQKRGEDIRRDPRGSLPDNMLALFGDAQKMAMDIRMVDPGAADDPEGRLNTAADLIYQDWKDSAKNKGTQLVFSDLGKPEEAGGSKDFSAYDTLIDKLVERGIPRNQIAHIYQAKNKAQRTKLFQEVNDGKIRVMLGSSKKAGVGVNVQERVYAMHHIDIPHVPADLEQREARGLRQGNTNPTVSIRYYLTRGSLDEMKFANVVRKAKFINQFLQGNSQVEEAEDVDGMVPSLQMFQAMASGDPRVMQKMETDAEIDRLSGVWAGWKNQQYRIRADLQQIPGRIGYAQRGIEAIKRDIAARDKAGNVWKIGGQKFSGDKIQTEVSDAIRKKLPKIIEGKQKDVEIGSAFGLPILASAEYGDKGLVSIDVGDTSQFGINPAEIGSISFYQRIKNQVESREEAIANREAIIEKAQKEEKNLKASIEDEWPYASKLQELVDKQARLVKELGADKGDESAAAMADGEEIVDKSVKAQEIEPTDDSEPPEDEDEEQAENTTPAAPQAAAKVATGDRVALARSLRPLSEFRKGSHKSWEGNVAEPGKYLTDGTTAFLADKVVGSKLGEVASGKRYVQQDLVAKVFDEAVEKANKPLKQLGVGRVSGKTRDQDHEVLYLTDDAGRIFSLDAAKAALAEKTIGPFEAFGQAPDKAVVLTTDGNPAAVLMPLKLEAKDTPDLAEASKLTRSDGKSSERGSIPALSDLAQALQKRFGDDGAPKANYSGLSQLRSKFAPGGNLSQLEKASKPAHTAAIRAASHRAQAMVILRQAIPQMKAKLKGGDVSLDEVFLALIESRLQGLRDRWQSFADQAEDMDDDELEKSYDDAFANLLDAVAGKKDLPQDISQTATALYQAKDWDTLRDFLASTFEDAAKAVTTVMEPEWFEAATGDPHFKGALEVYKKLVEDPIAENHSINEGVFSDALGPLDTYYPLIPLNQKQAQGPGRRLAYHKPKNIANAFATGMSDGYDPSVAALRDRIASAVRSNDKAALLKALEETGLVRKLGKGEALPESVKYKGEEYVPERVEMTPSRILVQGGKATHLPATFGVLPQWAAHELRPILEKSPNSAPTLVEKFLQLLNTVTLTGVAEPVFHATNLMGTLVANTPYLEQSIGGQLMSLPFAKKFGAIYMIAKTDPSTEEASRDLIEMSKVGLIPSRYGSVTYSKKAAEELGAERKMGSLAPFLFGPSGIDIRARLVMYRLAKAINPDASPQELYHFVNQLGNYVPALQSEMERAMKKTGFSPFITAGTTMLRNGLNAWLTMSGPTVTPGGGPVPPGAARSRRAWVPKTAVQVRMANAFTGGALFMLAIWAWLYKEARGKYPWNDPLAKLMAIPVTGKFRHSKIGIAFWGPGPEPGYINLGFFNPLINRGGRAMGIPGAFEAHVLHGNAGQIEEAALKDMLNAFAQPFEGPSFKAAFVGLTGQEPYITGLRDRQGNVGPQLFPMIPKGTKPGLPQHFTKKAFADSTDVQKAIAAAREINSFYGAGIEGLGQSTGFIGQDQGKKGNHFVRMMTDYAFPGLVGNATNPFARQEILRQQRSGTR